MPFDQSWNLTYKSWEPLKVGMETPHFQIYRPINDRLHAMHSIQGDEQGKISKHQLWAITLHLTGAAYHPP